ncbi:MAG: hypothetical protein HY000_39410 [Planctomycetes bacterium]|nr:hypothetical protein [Planctomycetota bacterium]
MTEMTKTIFVAWQDPAQRRFYPVARLALVGEDGGAGWYEFAYIGGAKEASEHGFQPFLAFPSLTEVYRSRELFPLFANRLTSPSRMDYPQYVERLGLDPNVEAPLDILGRSGGLRATDAVELFPMPARDPQIGGYTSYFLVHGIGDLPQVFQQRIVQLRPNEVLLPVFD